MYCTGTQDFGIQNYCPIESLLLFRSMKSAEGNLRHIPPSLVRPVAE